VKKLIIILLLAAAAWFGWHWYQQRQLHPGDLTLYGNVDIREVNLGFRVMGRIEKMLKDEGDSVKAGELLARLDAQPYRNETAEAQAQADSLRAKLEMQTNGYRQEDIGVADATVKEREATLLNARLLADRQKELVQKRAVSQQDYDDSAAKLLEAEARLISAQASAAMMHAGFRKEEIAQSKADLDKAETLVAEAKLKVEDSELKAAADGVVMTRAAEPGAIVQAGATIFTVSLRQPVWVRAYVNEPQLGLIHPGMAMRVFTDTSPGKAYHGQIGYISPRAEFTPKSVETTELRTSLVYRLRIVVTDADEGLRQGMPVTIKP